jgi:hypothetical protein
LAGVAGPLLGGCAQGQPFFSKIKFTPALIGVSAGFYDFAVKLKKI